MSYKTGTGNCLHSTCMALLPMETTSNRVTASTSFCLPWLPPAFLLCFTFGLLCSPFSESLRTILLRLCKKQSISKRIQQIQKEVEALSKLSSHYYENIFIGFSCKLNTVGRTHLAPLSVFVAWVFLWVSEGCRGVGILTIFTGKSQTRS